MCQTGTADRKEGGLRSEAGHDRRARLPERHPTGVID